MSNNTSNTNNGPVWIIDKTFHFSYGHRVWSQQLNGEYCENGNTCAACRHLHGHEAEVKVFLGAQQLERGMVTDFKHLGWLKNFLDDFVDHKFIIDIHDPLYPSLIGDYLSPIFITNDDSIAPLDPVFVPDTSHICGSIIREEILKEHPQEIVEMLEGFFIVDFVPTSENLTKWLYEVADAKMSKMDINVHSIEWNETPKSRAVYVGSH